MGVADAPTLAAFFGDTRDAPSQSFDTKRARATLSDRTAVLNGDFVLLISVVPSAEIGIPNLLAPRAVLETSAKHPDYCAMKVAFTPRDLLAKETTVTSPGLETLLLIDRSGSMQDKIGALRRAVGLVLAKLPKDSSFNICSFGWRFETLWPTSQALTPIYYQRAVHYLSTVKADLGGTEILSALRNCVDSRRGNQTQVLIFTDGEVWEGDQVVKYVQSIKNDLKDKIRFFALGIGDSVSHEMIEGIGKHGGGFAEVIAVQSSGNWDEQVTRMIHGLLTRSEWTFRINLRNRDGQASPRLGFSVRGGYSATTEAVLRAPHSLPSMHGFSRSVVYFLIPASRTTVHSVVVEDTHNPSLKREILVEHVKVQEPMIQQLAAKAIMHDLETGRSWMHGEDTRTKTAHNEHEVVAEVQHIGVKWGIAGKWTSFVGVSSSKITQNPTRIYRYEIAELSRPRWNPAYRRSSRSLSPCLPQSDDYLTGPDEIPSIPYAKSEIAAPEPANVAFPSACGNSGPESRWVPGAARPAAAMSTPGLRCCGAGSNGDSEPQTRRIASVQTRPSPESESTPLVSERSNKTGFPLASTPTNDFPSHEDRSGYQESCASENETCSYQYRTIRRGSVPGPLKVPAELSDTCRTQVHREHGESEPNWYFRAMLYCFPETNKDRMLQLLLSLINTHPCTELSLSAWRAECNIHTDLCRLIMCIVFIKKNCESTDDQQETLLQAQKWLAYLVLQSNRSEVWWWTQLEFLEKLATAGWVMQMEMEIA